ncbi:MAG: type II secretion system major pseudopilin GspG [Candidatus Omnitrophica bacterium]|nr:type II secretion system major pseudopilin GspG [Candidatus Omnitrophota bacterium]MCB9747406.1 type II secretion system major pseudopilin GspG [Candidatus Omnitrophota bacterium]
MRLRRLKKVQNSFGFTLIEIMLVVIIIGVLAAMVIPNISGRGKQAREAAARADIDANMSAALDLYELDNGVYPSTEEGLKALVEDPGSANNWNGPYLKKKQIPKDPWGREYVYASPGVHNSDEYDLSSLGPDGTPSDDDVVNWVK